MSGWFRSSGTTAGDRAADRALIARRGHDYDAPRGGMIERLQELGFLNTVRTERFDHVLAIKAHLLAIARAA